MGTGTGTGTGLGGEGRGRSLGVMFVAGMEHVSKDNGK